MPLDPNIILSGLQQQRGVDMNALLQQKISGMENINALERQRKSDELVMQDRAAKAAKEQEAAAIKALLPAYTYGIQTGDIAGAGNLVPPEMRDQLQPFIDALAGKSPQEVQSALIGSLSSSPEGQEALAAIQRSQTYGVQARQAKTAEDRLALDAERQAAELAAGNKVASREVDAQGNVHFFDAYGNEIRVAQGAGKPAASPAATDGVKLGPDQRMREDGTVEIIPGSQTYRKQKSVQSTDYGAATNALRELDKVRSVVSELKNTTGYQKAMNTGTIMANAPNIPGVSSYSGAYDFQTKYKNLKGSVATLGRAAASLQGKLGNMAVQEWKLVSDAIANLDLENMDADVLDAQLDIIANDIINLEAQVRDAYQKEWGDTQFYSPLEERGPAGAAEGTGDDPLGIR